MDNDGSRLDALSEKIDALREEQQSSRNKKDVPDKGNVGWGMYLLSQFFSALIVGLCIGLFLDRIFSTRGVFLIIFIIFGVMAGFLNCYRCEKLYNNEKNNRQGD